MQGLAVVPLFAGFDVDAPDASSAGRIYSFDVAGGRYPEQHFHSVGSGSLFARGALKKLWSPGLGRDETVRVTVEALYDAADDDAATGGPDITRRIFPVVMLATANGTERVDDDELDTVVRAIITDREITARSLREHAPCRCRSMPRPSRSCATARSSRARASRAVVASPC